MPQATTDLGSLGSLAARPRDGAVGVVAVREQATAQGAAGEVTSEQLAGLGAIADALAGEGATRAALSIGELAGPAGFRRDSTWQTSKKTMAKVIPGARNSVKHMLAPARRSSGCGHKPRRGRMPRPRRG